MITLKREKPKRDITKSNSISHAIEPLFLMMEAFDFETLKTEFINILNDKNISASTETRNKWLIMVNKCKTKMNLMLALKNLYLKGAGLY